MRRLFILLLVISFCALTLPSAPMTKVQGQTGIDPNQWYHIIAKHSGQCLDVQFASQADRAYLIQWYCHYGDNQMFRFNPVGGGYYQIITGNIGKCVDQLNANYNNGGLIGQYLCHSGPNQQFEVISGQVGTGYFNQIRVRHSGKNIDVTNASYTSGAQIIQYDPHGGDNQLFELRPASSTPCAGRDADSDGANACTDCNDNDPDVYPGAPTNCAFGEDRNCNGQDDYDECYGGCEWCF